MGYWKSQPSSLIPPMYGTRGLEALRIRPIEALMRYGIMETLSEASLPSLLHAHKSRSTSARGVRVSQGYSNAALMN
jgi:hypothetical protein